MEIKERIQIAHTKEDQLLLNELDAASRDEAKFSCFWVQLGRQRYVKVVDYIDEAAPFARLIQAGLSDDNNKSIDLVLREINEVKGNPNAKYEAMYIYGKYLSDLSQSNDGESGSFEEAQKYFKKIKADAEQGVTGAMFVLAKFIIECMRGGNYAFSDGLELLDIRGEREQILIQELLEDCCQKLQSNEEYMKEQKGNYFWLWAGCCYEIADSSFSINECLVKAKESLEKAIDVGHPLASFGMGEMLKYSSHYYNALGYSSQDKCLVAAKKAYEDAGKGGDDRGYDALLGLLYSQRSVFVGLAENSESNYLKEMISLCLKIIETGRAQDGDNYLFQIVSENWKTLFLSVEDMLELFPQLFENLGNQNLTKLLEMLTLHLFNQNSMLKFQALWYTWSQYELRKGSLDIEIEEFLKQDHMQSCKNGIAIPDILKSAFRIQNKNATLEERIAEAKKLKINQSDLIRKVDNRDELVNYCAKVLYSFALELEATPNTDNVQNNEERVELIYACLDEAAQGTDFYYRAWCKYVQDEYLGYVEGAKVETSIDNPQSYAFDQVRNKVESVISLVAQYQPAKLDEEKVAFEEFKKFFESVDAHIKGESQKHANQKLLDIITQIKVENGESEVPGEKEKEKEKVVEEGKK